MLKSILPLYGLKLDLRENSDFFFLFHRKGWIFYSYSMFSNSSFGR